MYPDSPRNPYQKYKRKRDGNKLNGELDGSRIVND